MKDIREFANKHAFPGWYIDVGGNYCYGNGKFLISIFVDSDDNTYNITVDKVEGLGDLTNYEWEFVFVDDGFADECVFEITNFFVKKYISGDNQ